MRASDVARSLRERYDRGDAGITGDIEAALDQYRFYHSIEVVPGLRTEGLDWAAEYTGHIAAVMDGLDFDGARVLDIGCRDGELSFKAEAMGAADVVGIDNDLSPGLVDFLIPFKRSKVRALELNVNHLSRAALGEFDVVLFAGVLYHLRYPVSALRRIADVLEPDGVLLIEGGFLEGFADLPLLFCPIGSDSPYERTSVTFFNEAGLRDTLVSIGFADVVCHDSYTYTVPLEESQSFCATRFPEYAERYGRDAPFAICRKIFSARRAWSDDPRINSHGSGADQKAMLERYWDGVHDIHTNIESDL